MSACRSTFCEAPPDSPVGAHYIEGARCICLTCIPDKDDFSRHISFCDDPECLGANHPDGFWSTSFYGTATVHRTTHDILKVRTVIHHLLWPSLSGQAAVALEFVRTPGILPDPPVEGAAVGAVEDKDEDKSEKPSEAVEPSKPEVATAAAEPSKAEAADTRSEAHVEDSETKAHEESPDIIPPPPPAADVDSPMDSTPKCSICRQTVYMGRCWRCLECQGASFISFNRFPVIGRSLMTMTGSVSHVQTTSATSATDRCSSPAGRVKSRSPNLSGTMGSNRVRDSSTRVYGCR